jgi:hypothetical protein
MEAESKGACQRCDEHLAFPSVMEGQEITCPHCGRQTTLVADAPEPLPPSILFDPDWQKRIPNRAVRAPLVLLELLVGLIQILLMVSVGVVILVVLLRCLHAAWGY